jgi:hypothetical protein
MHDRQSQEDGPVRGAGLGRKLADELLAGGNRSIAGIGIGEADKLIPEQFKDRTTAAGRLGREAGREDECAAQAQTASRDRNLIGDIRRHERMNRIVRLEQQAHDTLHDLSRLKYLTSKYDFDELTELVQLIAKHELE